MKTVPEIREYKIAQYQKSQCKKNLPSSKLKKKEKEKKHIKKTTKEVDLIITQKQIKSELKVSSVSKE